MVARLQPWLDLIAWGSAIVGALGAAVLALTGVLSVWWAIEVSALIALVGAFAGAEGSLRYRAIARHTSEDLRHIDEHSTECIFETTPEGVVRHMSNAGARLLGIPIAEAIGAPLRRLTDEPLPRFYPRGPAAIPWEATWHRGPGQRLQLATTLYPAFDHEGRLTVIRGVIRDQSERLEIEAALRESEERFRRVLDAAVNGIVLASHEGQLLLSNNAMRSLLGYTQEELASRSLSDIVHPAYIDQLMAFMASRAWSDAAPSNYEVQLVDKAGARIDVEVTLAAIREEDHATAILIEVRDLTEARRAFEAIQRMTDYDRLTGLPNRDLFNRHLQRAIVDARATQRSVAVVLLDLDRFKLINDTLGHASGDRLLQSVAERLSSVVPPRHIVARFSGDEYLILCPDISGVAAAEATARRVLTSFLEPFDIDGHSLQVAGTAGVSVYPNHAQDGETLIRLADAALHEAKADGGNTYRTGSDDADDPARRRFELESDLRQAVDQQELTLHYQPQVDPTNGDITGFEALLRWNHPERGMVRPDEFVPLLEETGLIVDVGEQVLRQAIEQARIWHDDGLDVRVAVNISPRQFLVADLDDRIKAILDEAGLPPEALEVELTESAGLLDLDSVSGILDTLHEIGITTAIDDFGIGQSWLGRLQQFHIGTLKIDRSFIQRVGASGNDLAIVEAVVALGHALGMTVVAEGVETQEQLDVVRSIGCDLVQGFLYSPPVSADDATRMLRYGFAQGQQLAA
ncbi:MAG: EAL domain-containing protein [Dehalococcoidia bacterium]|nr:EAL domain-containing protein [Dehalococcoidia bacterium]